MITVDDIITSGGKRPELLDKAPHTVMEQAALLAARVNAVMAAFGSSRAVNSGWRTPAINKAAGGARNSLHIVGAAVDLTDTGRTLSAWLMGNLDLVERVGLWIEDPKFTPTWVHLQCLPPKSGKRVFVPSRIAKES